MKPTDGRENAPEQCCLPAQGRRVSHGAAGGRMTHCSENSLFQTSGQAAAQGGSGWDPQSSTWSVGSPPPDLPAAGYAIWGPLGSSVPSWFYKSTRQQGGRQSLHTPSPPPQPESTRGRGKPSPDTASCSLDPLVLQEHRCEEHRCGGSTPGSLSVRRRQP